MLHLVGCIDFTFVLLSALYVLVAQSDRATDFYSVGYRFNSCRGCYEKVLEIMGKSPWRKDW